MITADDAGQIIGQAQSVVDSPETVAVYSIFWAVLAASGLAVMAWACFKGHQRHLDDLRTMIPALEESTHVQSELTRAIYEQNDRRRRYDQ